MPRSRIGSLRPCSFRQRHLRAVRASNYCWIGPENFGEYDTRRCSLEQLPNRHEHGIDKKLPKIPRRLYKYRDFDNRTLEIVVSDKVYYADPSTFNDPLDTQPSIDVNLEDGELERIVRTLVERRTSKEMSAAAKTIKYRGPRTIDHIKRHSRRQADRLIKEIEYNATDPEYDDFDDPKCSLLGDYIEEELLRQYDKGIVSLAERSTCRLMWSHYGDQHRGICIGYSVPVNAAGDLHKVKYGSSRLVQASKVAAMLDGNDVARGEVDEAVLLRKAKSWGYEREWRLIGSCGLRSSPLELEEIIFGMRCNDAAQYVVMKALKGRERPVKFFEMREVSGTFKLNKCALSYDDERFVHFPRRSPSIHEMFEPLPTAESSAEEE